LLVAGVQINKFVDGIDKETNDWNGMENNNKPQGAAEID
jgi:hypothetical protein